MSASTQIKKAAREYAAENGVKYTTALRAVSGAASVSATAASYPKLVVGQRIRFAEYRTSMTVRAISTDGRFVALTQKMFGDLSYTVMDLELGIRGTATSYGVGFTTDEDCREAVAAFERSARIEREHNLSHNDAGELLSEVSYRNWVWLRYTDSQPDKRTEAMVPELRALTYAAPPRTYNDHRNPRTALEQAMHQPSGTVMLARPIDGGTPRLAVRHLFQNSGRNNGKGGWLLADEAMDASQFFGSITDDGASFRQLLPTPTNWILEEEWDDDDELDEAIDRHLSAARKLIDRSPVGAVILFGVQDAGLKVGDDTWMATTCVWEEDGEDEVGEWFTDCTLDVVGSFA